MATGDLASTGMSAADIASLIGLVSPPGSSVKNVGEVDTDTTKGATNGVNNTYTTSTTGPSNSSTNIGGSTKVQSIGPSSSTTTTQDHVDTAGVNRAIQQILEGSQGLAATASGQHISGGYNSTTDMLLKNDLAARTAGTVSLLNKSTTSTTNNSGSVNTLIDSGSVNTTQNSGSRTDAGVTAVTHTDPTTDSTKNAPYNISTNQTAQISGKVAAGIAAGSLIYNAAGQLINKASGALVDSVTGGAISQSVGDALFTTGELFGDYSGGSAVAGSVAAGVGTDAAVGEGVAAAGTAAESAGILDGLGTAAEAALAWIVCTELMKQGRLNKRWYFSGSVVFNSYSEISKIGYYIWAIPAVKHLRKYPNSYLSKFLELIFNWRAEYIASTLGVKSARKLVRGMIVSAFLYPTCCTLGHVLYFFGIKKDYHVIYR